MSLEKYELYDRQYELVIKDAAEALTIRHLDLQAKIKKTSTSKPSEAEITILNMTKAHKEFVRRAGLNVMLSAGFGDNIGQIFKGSNEYTPTKKEPTDWLCSLNARDGAINYSTINFSMSFKKGTPIQNVIKAFIKKLKLPPAMQDGLDKINELAEGTIKLDQLKRKYDKQQQSKKNGRKKNKKDQTFEEFQAKETAKAKDRQQNADQVKLLKAEAYVDAGFEELDVLCRAYGLKYTVTDQVLHIMPAGAPVSSEIILLNWRSGLLGSPEPQEDGAMKIRSLLRHEYNPNVLVFVESRDWNAPFLIKTVEHNLDTMGAGESWYSDLECIPYDAS
jgi:hypothetical protein